MRLNRDVEKWLNRSGAMTVGEMIEVLQQFDEDSLVLVVSDYGDISHTQQVQEVETVDELGERHPEELVQSGYSRSGIAVSELSAEDVDGDDRYGVVDGPDVVLIRL